MSSHVNQSSNYILNLELTNFRNIEHAHLDFSPHFNLIVGDNGHGKTNLLEAVAMACSLKPMQNLTNFDLINNCRNQAQLEAHFKTDGFNEIKLTILEQGKKAELNGKTVKNASALQEILPIVSFIPLELNMINLQPSLRRRALDLAASSLSLEHSANLRAYDKVLRHRNHLLKAWPIDHESLNTFTELLFEKASAIIHQRLFAMETLKDDLRKFLQQILGLEHELSMQYLASNEKLEFLSHWDLLALLKAQHLKLAQVELKRRSTLFGPHLDDLVFMLNGFNAQKHASRGQARAIVLAFKLAQMLAISKLRNFKPIVILDDIVSELDEKRCEHLLSLVQNLGFQSFLSATGLSYFGSVKYFGKNRVFQIAKGSIRTEDNAFASLLKDI